MEKFPNNPTEYGFSDHFMNEVLEEENRSMTFGMALETIQHGRKQEANGDADMQFVRSDAGIEVYVLVGFDTHYYQPVVITGWPAVYDPTEAIRRGAWTEQELETIYDFTKDCEEDLEDGFHYPPK